MPKFKIKVQWEAEVEAINADDAPYEYFKELEEDSERLEDIVSNSLTVKEL